MLSRLRNLDREGDPNDDNGSKRLENAINPIKENPTNYLIDYLKPEPTSFLGIRFLVECGVKLGAEPITISTAAIIYHKFYKKADPKIYDFYLVASTSLYLASKVESQLLKIRDVINVSRCTIYRNNPPLEFDELFTTIQNSIFDLEALIIRAISFQVNIDHPERYLVHYMKSLEEWIGTEEWIKYPIARTSWAFVFDFHHDSSILDYSPKAIGIAAIELSLTAYGISVPLCSSTGRNSWQMIFYSKYDKSETIEIMTKMLANYETELGVLSDLLFLENKVKGRGGSNS